MRGKHWNNVFCGSSIYYSMRFVFFSIRKKFCNHKFATTTPGLAIIMCHMHLASHAYDMKSISFCVDSFVLVRSCLGMIRVRTTCGICHSFVQLHQVKARIFSSYGPAQAHRFIVEYSSRQRNMCRYSIFIFVWDNLVELVFVAKA